ncbi:MAG: tRNA pseudouridine(38-40) synthase TruA [Bacteroidetes bacterium]|nr:tRNA pseudouridine(38-40) synthase TruA [Bacteroidota bacterium]
MSRYFLELAYMGTRYAGFQRQENAHSVQAEVEQVLAKILRKPVILTGSSRTDAGVHALQNYFHFDTEHPIPASLVYNFNAVLPHDIVVKGLYLVADNAHCRFDAVARKYAYHISLTKDPFSYGRAYYFPYTLDVAAMQAAAQTLFSYHDFTSFSKRNTQVKTFLCQIEQSNWELVENGFIYHVRANRFLRGMVRGLTGTMLKVGRGKLSVDGFREIIEKRDCTLADFAVPGHGLFLEKVEYPAHVFNKVTG